MLNDDLKSYILTSLRDTCVKRYKSDRIFIIGSLLLVVILNIIYWVCSVGNDLLFSIMPMFTLVGIIKVFELLGHLFSLDAEDYKSGKHYLYKKGKLVSSSCGKGVYEIESDYLIEFPVGKRIKKCVTIEFLISNFEVISGKILA